MARRKLLLLLKPFDVYEVTESNPISHFNNTRVLNYLDNRHKVHKEAINLCQKILQQKSVDWKPIFRNNLFQPIRNVDLVVTVGGDGTLLQASHFIDDSIPVLGVNSDPTQAEEVEEFSNEFDATRSTGYLCAATVKNFEQVLDGFLVGQTVPCKLSRISVSVNSEVLSTYALNDILIAHPCPATVSRFSFKIKRDYQTCSPLVNCRSSGIRVSTAAGSTAAMLSAGGFAMPISSQDLQYMETSGFFFCLQDRALLCRKCDVAMHTASPYVSSHQRFLLTGVKVGLETTTDPGASSSKDKSASHEKTSETKLILNPESRLLCHFLLDTLRIYHQKMLELGTTVY